MRAARWKRGLVPFSHGAPITTEYWDDDGRAEFAQMYARLEREGMALESPGGGREPGRRREPSSSIR